MVDLIPVTCLEQVEWLRVNRNDPRIYKYFRQDKPITENEQRKWWINLVKYRVKLFIVEQDGKRVGYFGFNPFNQYAQTAEFGGFIIHGEQKHGYGKEALLKLFSLGFNEWNIKTIVSEVLDYTGEDRFVFYKKLGFEPYPNEHQNIRYMKRGQWVDAIKFYMTKDMWDKRYGKNGNAGLGHVGIKASNKQKVKGMSRIGVYSG